MNLVEKTEPSHNGACPKCHYVRLAKEDAPQWQCPKCGVAYHKVKEAASVPNKLASIPKKPIEEVFDADQELIYEVVEPRFGGKYRKYILVAVLVVPLAWYAWSRANDKQKLERQEAMQRFQQIDQFKQHYNSEDPNLLLAETAFDRGGIDKAVQVFEKFAEQGNPRAMMWLWRVYDRGQGAVKDVTTSNRWLEQAVYSGYALAYVQRGLLSETGASGYGKDLRLAHDYYRKAAAKNNSAGLLSLAHFYNEGIGVTQDFGKTYTLLKMAKLAMEKESQEPSNPFAPHGIRGFDANTTSYLLEDKLTPVMKQLALSDANEWFADPKQFLKETE
jgi:uncharacterized protein